jgi:hypothetical protein
MMQMHYAMAGAPYSPSAGGDFLDGLL